MKATRGWRCTSTSAAACALLLAACGGDGGGGGGDRDAESDAEVREDAGRDAAQNDAAEESDAGSLPTAPDAIESESAGMRNDPEGIAAPSATQKLTWRDAAGRARSLHLGGYLYQYDLTVDDGKQLVERSAGDDAYGHAGFGYVVSHNTQTGNSPLGKANVPTSVRTRVLSGGHHALHRVELVYDRDKEGGGNGLRIPVVIEWLVATGRDHPIWSITYQLGKVENPQGVNLDDYRMDTRAPYGSLNFDGAASKAQGDEIGGIEWGDSGFLFRTGGANMTLASAWTYDTPNTVNFVRAYTRNVNAELGIVQTKAGDKELAYGDRVVGRERGSNSAAAYQNKGDCSALGDNRNYAMPCIGGWPYQLMNYDWAGDKPVNEGTGTKLLAWGSPYGYLGASSFSLFDYSGDVDGRGDRAYATFIVMGPKCRIGAADACNEPGDVANAVAQVEALSALRIETTTGALVEQAPRGPGAASNEALTQGYDDAYAAHRLRAARGKLAFTLQPAAGKAVQNPLLLVQDYPGGVPRITLDGAAVAVNSAQDAGAFVSYDAANQTLWVTLQHRLDAPLTVTIDAP